MCARRREIASDVCNPREDRAASPSGTTRRNLFGRLTLSTLAIDLGSSLAKIVELLTLPLPGRILGRLAVIRRRRRVVFVDGALGGEAPHPYAARFRTAVTRQAEERWGASGMDAVEFLISTNPGEIGRAHV